MVLVTTYIIRKGVKTKYKHIFYKCTRETEVYETVLELQYEDLQTIQSVLPESESKRACIFVAFYSDSGNTLCIICKSSYCSSNTVSCTMYFCFMRTFVKYVFIFSC